MASHQKRGDSYLIVVSLGLDSNGKRKKKTLTWTPNSKMTARQIEKELERQKHLFEELCTSGQIGDGAIKLSDFSKLYFENYAETVLKPSTLQGYTVYLPRILEAMGHLRLDKIHPAHINAFITNLGDEGIRNDVKYKSEVDFRKLIKDKDLTAVSAAKVCDISPTTFYSLFKGNNVQKHIAKKIAKGFDVRLDKLFSPDEKKRTLSSKTIKGYWSLLSSILQRAVYWQYIGTNPCSRVEPPRVKRTPARYLDIDEINRLLEALEGAPARYKLMIITLLYTGLRRGELLGLKWGDIIFDENLIYIRRESLYSPKKGIYDEDGKTSSSIRSLSIPEALMQQLKNHQEEQIKLKKQLIGYWNESNRVFTGSDGKVLHPATLTNWFASFAKEHNFNISIHGLRHTNASLLFASTGNVSLSTSSQRLGHSSTSVTSKIYAHMIRKADEEAALSIDKILGKAK